MSGRRDYWVVRLGKGNEFADVCRKRNLIAIGWRELDLDLSLYANLDQRAFTNQVAEKLAAVSPDKSEKSVLSGVRQLFKFAVLLKPGDVVIAPANSEGLRYFGVVRGPYQYVQADGDLPFRHRREIEWITSADKATFSESLRNSSGAIMTLFSVNPHGEEIEQLLAGREPGPTGVSREDLKEFGMESHLEDFIVENWERIPALKGFELYREDGEVVGQQYSTSIGRIDLLALSNDKKTWLIIELKKGKTSDDVVGQTLRYIGWVKKNEAEPGQEVRGLIIAGTEDERLLYALETLANVGFMTYSVNFNLRKVR